MDEPSDAPQVQQEPERDMRRACHEKKRYATAKLASAVAARVFDDRGQPLRWYACTACGGWHLTKAVTEWKTGFRPPLPPRGHREREHGREGRRRRKRH